MTEDGKAVAAVELAPDVPNYPARDDASVIASPDDRLSDEVVGLREWGTSRMLQLPDRGVASPAMVSRGVEMIYERQSWWIKDWTGVAGLRQDGIPRREVALTAGAEITTSGQTLIAESPRSIALRGFCSRLIGWSDDRMSTVDRALRAIRLASSGRLALFLRGEGYLVPIAYALHRHMLGGAAPFIVSDRRRQDTPATVRGPANFKTGMVAFRNACGGSLCVGMLKQFPVDFDEVLRAFREPNSDVRLIVCAMAPVRVREGVGWGPVPLDIPSLRSRSSELLRIVSEYANDAIASLHAPDGCFEARDAEWVMKHFAVTISEIEKATLRVVAIKASRDLTNAARRLGMALVSLTRWLRPRANGSPVPQPWPASLRPQRTS
jgi:hypothetical protein